MTVPPRGRSARFAFNAAGFIATSTVGASPGVTTEWSAKCNWNADTPGIVPAGARISAGKSGSVDRLLPNAAVSTVNRSPVNCIPSPESPANRMITCDRVSTGLPAVSVRHRDSPGSWRLTLVFVRPLTRWPNPTHPDVQHDVTTPAWSTVPATSQDVTRTGRGENATTAWTPDPPHSATELVSSAASTRVRHTREPAPIGR